MKKLVNFALLCFLTALHISCGGESPTSTDDDNTVTKTYIVTGSILTGTGTGISGITVTLSGQSPKTSTTDAQGSFTFSGIENGSYTVTPTKTGYQFNPASRQVAVSGANVTVSVIVAAVSGGSTTGYDIQGLVVDTAGKGIEFIRVMLEDVIDSEKWSVSITNEKGEFAFDDKTSGTYRITPISDWHTFSPESSTITFTGTAITLGSFIGTETPTETTYAVFGRVVDSAGTGIASAELRIYRQGESDLISAINSDSQGSYQFTGLIDGTYEVYVYKEDVTFTKESQTVTVSGADLTDVDFAEVDDDGSDDLFTITGKITDVNGAGISGILVEATAIVDGEDLYSNETTDAEGNYLFDRKINATWQITPVSNDYTFSPEFITVVVNNENAAASSIIASSSDDDSGGSEGTGIGTGSYTVTGRVVDTSGKGIANITVTIFDDFEEASTTTDSNGYYTMQNIATGSYGLYCDETDDYQFEPWIGHVDVEGKDSTADKNFVGSTP